jgi:cohesin complex subunit SCC1
MTGNNDLTGQPVNPVDLNLPEVLTEADLLANLDMSNLLSQSLNLDTSDKLQNFGTDWTSTLNPESSTQSRLTPEDRPQLEDDTGLELDLGEDVPLGGGDDTGVSVEIGRAAPPARSIGEDLFSDDNKILDGNDLDLDLGEDVPMPDAGGLDLAPTGDHDNINNALGDDDEMALGGDETLPLRNAGAARRSESPLSDARSEVIRDLDHTFGETDETEEQVVAHQRQRSKKRKLLVLDTETTLHNHQIKEQQNDRSKILKPVSFLPKDPLLLTLMNMQKNGEFVSNIMGDGRSRGWAPELRGILSIDVVRSAGELKRKRDSGISDVGGNDAAEKAPRLELGDEEELVIDEGIGLGGDSSLNRTQFELPADDGIRNEQEDDDEGIGPGYDDFDDTTVPLIHPADNGPISLGTKHAVHLLRERFGGEEAGGSPASQVKKSVLFQDLLPEGKATREDATKLFFEVLVLATKDAVKVEQIGGDKVLGGPLRVRGKRGLWGSWAESQTEPALAT